jgi:transcriptional regulator with XRE-family HTH domain
MEDTSTSFTKDVTNIRKCGYYQNMKETFDIAAMRARLRSALEEKGLSMRQVSIKAECGPGYVHSVLEEGKEPTVTKLAQICNAADLSMSFILYGVKLSPETERLISLFEENPEKRDGILALLQP